MFYQNQVLSQISENNTFRGFFNFIFILFQQNLNSENMRKAQQKMDDTLVFYSGTITNYDFRRNNEEKKYKKVNDLTF